MAIPQRGTNVSIAAHTSGATKPPRLRDSGFVIIMPGRFRGVGARRAGDALYQVVDQISEAMRRCICGIQCVVAGIVFLLVAACAPVATDDSAADEASLAKTTAPSAATAKATAPPGDEATGERHVGYYYPPITSRERYQSRARRLDGADRDRRIGFVTAITRQQFTFG